MPMPERPAWNADMTKEELEQNEASYFQQYVQHIYAQYPSERLNYFEHNLEVSVGYATLMYCLSVVLLSRALCHLSLYTHVILFVLIVFVCLCMCVHTCYTYSPFPCFFFLLFLFFLWNIRICIYFMQCVSCRCLETGKPHVR